MGKKGETKFCIILLIYLFGFFTTDMPSSSHSMSSGNSTSETCAMDSNPMRALTDFHFSLGFIQ